MRVQYMRRGCKTLIEITEKNIPQEGERCVAEEMEIIL
jgi:hypothetical protein